MADSIESEAELKPHVSILPEVSLEVLRDLTDESTHPVAEHFTHLISEQTALYRSVMVKANLIPITGMSPQRAFMAGAAFTHEALHEQAARDEAKAIANRFDTAAEEPDDNSEVKIAPFRVIKIGKTLVILARQEEIRREIAAISAGADVLDPPPAA